MRENPKAAVVYAPGNFTYRECACMKTQSGCSVCTGENQLLAENVLVCEAHVYRPACVCVYEYEGGRGEGRSAEKGGEEAASEREGERREER